MYDQIDQKTGELAISIQRNMTFVLLVSSKFWPKIMRILSQIASRSACSGGGCFLNPSNMHSESQSGAENVGLTRAH
jgi:hypothetical protein